MPRIISFQLDYDEDLDGFLAKKYPDLKDYRILSKSLDARKAPLGKAPIFHYKLEWIQAGESFSASQESFSQIQTDIRPIIIGAGPAGLFCALRLAEYGIKTTIIERGEPAKTRMLAISKYWRRGVLDTESNVCFGEGGAGLFSDGKLITRIKSPLVKYVMESFVNFGAPKEVAYISNPHLGSNKIRKIISKMSEFLLAAGHEIIYQDKVADLICENKKMKGVRLASGREIFSEQVILATGHSAKDVYFALKKHEVAMQAKSFAVGVRIEHPRQYIDEIQHGKFYESLEAARYKLSYHNRDTDKGTYSFCMCPGGYVLSSTTEEGTLVSNGMSNFARNSPWSNSALVVTVKAGEDFDASDSLEGLNFQESIEREAFKLSSKLATGRELPAMTVGEFLKGKLNDEELPKTSCPSKLVKVDIRKIFPDFINQHLADGLREFDKRLRRFSYKDAVLIAPETRTSAPVTVLRDKERLESLSHQGLYPAGEGAGYAGGITSAAVDGIKIAESIVKSLS